MCLTSRRGVQNEWKKDGGGNAAIKNESTIKEYSKIQENLASLITIGRTGTNLRKYFLKSQDLITMLRFFNKNFSRKFQYDNLHF